MLPWGWPTAFSLLRSATVRLCPVSPIESVIYRCFHAIKPSLKALSPEPAYCLVNQALLWRDTYEYFVSFVERYEYFDSSAKEILVILVDIWSQRNANYSALLLSISYLWHDTGKLWLIYYLMTHRITTASSRRNVNASKAPVPLAKPSCTHPNTVVHC